MIKDQKISLNGKEIPNVREISVRLETPSDIRGIYREPTFAATIHIVRDASDNPIVDLFDMATNEDGRKNIITSGTLEFHGDDVKDQYSFDLNRYFISSWSLDNPTTPNAPTLESIELRVGAIKFNAGGGGSNFELRTFR
jgi:hypothetical protein